jgi:hypothetical protein
MTKHGLSPSFARVDVVITQPVTQSKLPFVRDRHLILYQRDIAVYRIQEPKLKTRLSWQRPFEVEIHSTCRIKRQWNADRMSGALVNLVSHSSTILLFLMPLVCVLYIARPKIRSRGDKAPGNRKRLFIILSGVRLSLLVLRPLLAYCTSPGWYVMVIVEKLVEW